MSCASRRVFVSLVAATLLVLTLVPSLAGAEAARVDYPLSIDTRNSVAVWNGFGFAEYREQAGQLGAQPTCTYRNARGEKLEPQCAVVVATSPSGGTQFVFTPAPPPLASYVLVTNTKANALAIPIEACSFSGVEPYATLYAGATTQLLQVTASSSACAHRLTLQSNLEFVAGSSRVSVQVLTDDTQAASVKEPVRPAVDDPAVVTLSVTGLPATLGDAWTIVSALEPSLGTLNVRTAPNPIAVATDESGAPVLGVHYEADFFEQRHTPKSVAGHAVLTASEQGKSEFLYVHNQPKVSVTGMDALLRSLQKDRVATCQCELEDEDEDYKCEYRSNPWKVETLSWHDSAWIRYPDGLNPEAAGTRTSAGDGKCVSEAELKKARTLPNSGRTQSQQDLAKAEADLTNVKADLAKAEADLAKAEAGPTQVGGRPVAATESAEAQEVATTQRTRVETLEKAALRAQRTVQFKAAQLARKTAKKRRRYSEGWAHGEVLLESLDDLTFSVFQAEVQPFEVMVTLRDPQHLDRTLFATKVKLANAARRESIPLPIKDMLFVACGELGEATIIPEIAGFTERVEGVDIILNGTTRAINEDDLKAGQCFLQYSPTRSSDAIHQKGNKRRTIESLVHFGRQEIEVVLRRGASEKKVLWTLDPTREQSIPLPQPADSKETGVYVAHAVVRGPMPPEVVYRPAAAINATERPILALGDLEFKANLRPRGRFGWVMFPIRTFVTIPVELAGFRLPANARELESSSEDSKVQLVTGRTGVLIALEPWDYDRGVNPWPIPARLMTGMSLFRLGEGRFVPSAMTGVQLSFPILDLPKGSAEDQLGTDASLGFFWEHDLQEGGGNHLMITMGANLLTLFGSK